MSMPMPVLSACLPEFQSDQPIYSLSPSPNLALKSSTNNIQGLSKQLMDYHINRQITRSMHMPSLSQSYAMITNSSMQYMHQIQDLQHKNKVLEERCSTLQPTDVIVTGKDNTTAAYLQDKIGATIPYSEASEICAYATALLGRIFDLGYVAPTFKALKFDALEFFKKELRKKSSQSPPESVTCTESINPSIEPVIQSQYCAIPVILTAGNQQLKNASFNDPLNVAEKAWKEKHKGSKEKFNKYFNTISASERETFKSEAKRLKAEAAAK
ncbi:hypothetical protein SERLA73DRAFT_148939 [Serpula lacrymans var. lacrymans S7.3]|uniref:Uncharacterized protein n=2 Tax=Serpula lacrymans var. lacrymans TaxID=341189 RepID=F8PGY4_SERL3|nr:uncharacterized protein SERLADRAFT_404546 [Serpula lacrymans var. lacrymans S7.9]EGO04421.1 hypothetical protein SERLA73DRAFT_148939 [Serpula lacrymans var. lacrymans S7.3]EGO30320.1 hypothetical protein SERLADRAFT_404546 [Serpula lacrymans var. lacrymans S7.9]